MMKVEQLLKYNSKEGSRQRPLERLPERIFDFEKIVFWQANIRGHNKAKKT